jgi:hypothetical protein
MFLLMYLLANEAYVLVEDGHLRTIIGGSHCMAISKAHLSQQIVLETSHVFEVTSPSIPASCSGIVYNQHEYTKSVRSADKIV